MSLSDRVIKKENTFKEEPGCLGGCKKDTMHWRTIPHLCSLCFWVKVASQVPAGPTLEAVKSPDAGGSESLYP